MASSSAPADVAVPDFLMVVAACRRRFDVMFSALVTTAVLCGLALRPNIGFLRPGVKRLVLLAASGPALLLVYNVAVYRSPFEFANGAYSAKAIEQKSILAG